MATLVQPLCQVKLVFIGSRVSHQISIQSVLTPCSTTAVDVASRSSSTTAVSTRAWRSVSTTMADSSRPEVYMCSVPLLKLFKNNPTIYLKCSTSPVLYVHCTTHNRIRLHYMTVQSLIVQSSVTTHVHVSVLASYILYTIIMHWL